MRPWITTGLFLLLPACPSADLDRYVFPCAEDSECPPGQRCDPEQELCVDPLALPDSGLDVPDSGLEVSDAGLEMPDTGVDPEPMTCFERDESSWCFAATAAALEARVAQTGAQVVDLEAESNDPTKFVAVLTPNDGVARDWTYDARREEISTIFGRRMTLTDIEPFARNGENLHAATFTARANLCPNFWYIARAGTAQDLRSAVDGLTSLPIVTLKRYLDLDTNRLTFTGVNFGTGTTTIALDVSGEEVAFRLRDKDVVLRSFEYAGPDRFDVVFGARQEDDPVAIWMFDATAQEIEQAATDRNAHVAQVGTGGSAPGRFAALLVENSTRSASVQSESARLARMLAGGTRSATVGVYRKERGRSPDLFFNERRPFRAGQMMALFVADRALVAEIQDEGVLAEEIALPSPGCSTSTATEVATIRDALERMIRDGDTRASTGLVERFGLDALDEQARQLPLTASTLPVAPGCETNDLWSDSSLLDQAIMLEYVLHCGPLNRYNPTLRRWLPGFVPSDGPANPDPERLRNMLDALIVDEATRAGLGTKAIAAISSEAEIGYGTSTLSEPGVVRRAIAGRIRTVRCDGNQIVHAVDFFGLYVEGEADQAEAETALRQTMMEILRGPVRRGLSSGGACYPQ